MEGAMVGTVGKQQGSALIFAILAMLVMGTLGVAFSLLADLESRLSVAHAHQARAEALAEAGLERALDSVRTAVSAPAGFTPWLDGTAASHLLVGGQPLDDGRYWARIDNDCPPAVPVALREGAVCSNSADANEVAVVTAWAISGQGRSRVRARVGVDTPWKHVCSTARPDGLCNEPGRRNGTPAVTPADPNDPNGPRAHDDLPRPYLGCSRVASGLHRAPGVPVATQHGLCQGFPQMYAYPYPTGGGTPRLVMTGGLPGPLPGRAPKSCNDEPAGGNGNRYFGHFDCALTTYCLPALGDVCAGVPGPPRKGCLRGSLWWARFSGTIAPLVGVTGPDTRVVPGHPHQVAQNPGFARYGEYDPALGACVDTAAPGIAIGPGMVFTGSTRFDQDVGSPARQLDVYVMGNWAQGSNRAFYGTLAVEGSPAGGSAFQAGAGGSTQLWAGPDTAPAGGGWSAGRTYGYPLVALIYNPTLPPPTVEPAYAPQILRADLGGDLRIHGVIYSGGHVQLSALTLDGSIVAFELRTQGRATAAYSTTYGSETPPSGFPSGGGHRIAMFRKSFVECASYHDDTAGPTPCG
jgi:Tfp pilus assembly protein PilX